MTVCLNGCATAPIECHEWTIQEKRAMKKADMDLSKDNALHPLIRDYEGICVEQSAFRI